jgi:hypothetical protein
MGFGRFFLSNTAGHPDPKARKLCQESEQDWALYHKRTQVYSWSSFYLSTKFDKFLYNVM